MRLARISDIYPDKAQYLQNQTVIITADIESDAVTECELRLKVTSLRGRIFSEERAISAKKNEKRQEHFTVVIPAEAGMGFGVDAELICSGESDRMSTAFDVVDDWRNYIRYGFLSDFSPEDEEDISDVQMMSKLHLNTIQFYDWMYRHDELVPKQDYFDDPLGRKLSLKAIKNKISACEAMGIKPFAYGAIYASSKEFYRDHSNWGLFKLNGEPLIFGDLLMFMDISDDSQWKRHIVNEYKDAVRSLGFKGIHMDTYGYPKVSYVKRDGKLKSMDLAEHMPGLISDAKEGLHSVDSDSAVILNAVNDWPIEAIASSPQDSVYIEVWPPHERYIHLYELVKHAKELGRKQVMLAAYIEPFLHARTDDDIIAAENALLLAFAVINASGGYHFIFGENNCALCHAYYVNHAVLRDPFANITRRYMDHIVRYAELLYDMSLEDATFTRANGINHEINFHNGEYSSTPEAGKVWTVVKHTGSRVIINLVNLCGLKDDLWNTPKPNRPTEIDNIRVRFFLDAELRGINYASPDFDSSKPKELPYEYEEDVNGRYYSFTIPCLQIWDTIWIDY
jgi:dextranase